MPDNNAYEPDDGGIVGAERKGGRQVGVEGNYFLIS